MRQRHRVVPAVLIGLGLGVLSPLLVFLLALSGVFGVQTKALAADIQFAVVRAKPEHAADATKQGFQTVANFNLTQSAVQGTRTISTTAPLSGGGDLTANRTLTIAPATTAAAGSMSAADKLKLDGLSPTAGDDTYICGRWGFTAAPASTSARWASITWGAILTAQAANAIHIAPANAQVVRMTAKNTNGLTGADITYSLDVGRGVSAPVNEPGLSVTITDGSTAAVTDTDPGISISAGDTLWARVVQANTTADAQVDARIDILCKSVP